MNQSVNERVCTSINNNWKWKNISARVLVENSNKSEALMQLYIVIDISFIE